MPSKYTTGTSGASPNYVSDHCVIAVVRDARLSKRKPCFVEKRGFLAWSSFILGWSCLL